MTALSLHPFHEQSGGRFAEVNGMEVVNDYGDIPSEHAALLATAGVIDLSFRSRLCLTGSDRQRFLHGQVTNNVKDLKTGQGCYAALVTAKGKMQSDLNIYCLADELLLDFEPGLGAAVVQRLEKYVIADDVQITDVAPLYGLLSVQGPQSAALITKLGIAIEPPTSPLCFASVNDPTLGEIYCVNQPRTQSPGFDLFVPVSALATLAERMVAMARHLGGRLCGWTALETARIEAGIPRFGADMDETNLAPEAGIDQRAVSYTKGCYIGQEVIARIRTYGQVAKSLRGLHLADHLKTLPKKGDKLFHGDKEAGYITSSVASPSCHANIALGYVRKEHNQIGTELTLRSAAGDSPARIVELPFKSG